MYLDDQDNAGKAWEQAVKLDPEDPGIRANYAAFWLRLGVHQRALEQLNLFKRLAQQISNISPEVHIVTGTLTGRSSVREILKNSSSQEFLNSIFFFNFESDQYLCHRYLINTYLNKFSKSLCSSWKLLIKSIWVKLLYTMIITLCFMHYA